MKDADRHADTHLDRLLTVWAAGQRPSPKQWEALWAAVVTEDEALNADWWQHLSHAVTRAVEQSTRVRLPGHLFGWPLPWPGSPAGNEPAALQAYLHLGSS